MALVTTPNVIEVSDFTAGWCPDLEQTSTPPNGLLQVKNLVPEKSTGATVTRRGYKALPNFSLVGYKVRAVHPYNRTNGDQYLMLVATNETSSGDNIQVWAYNLKTETAARVDTAGRTWNSTGGRHYGFTADDVFYGGGEKDAMYRYFPPFVSLGAWSSATSYVRGDGVSHSGSSWTCLVANQNKTPSTGSNYWTKVWDADASAKTYDTLVTGTPTSGQVAHNSAFQKRDGVTYQGKNYSAAKDNRFDVWETDRHYTKGDLVSNKGTYWRSYKCHAGHDSAAGTEPGTGASWKTVWEPHNLELPVNADGDASPDWNLIPDAPKTSVAVFHGNRMFGRYDNQRSDTMLFSAQADFQGARHEGIPDTVFDPTDWKVTGAAGAGWEPFETQEGDNITALLSFGFYLLVFKRHSVHVLADVDPANWNKRQLAPVGAINKNAACEHDGLVYFVGDQGFYVTDGSTVQEVEGVDKVRAWLRKAVDWDGDFNDVTLWSFGGYVWLSLPTGKGKNPDEVLVYDPATRSFWKQDIHIQDIAVNRKSGTDQLFFVSPTVLGNLANAVCVWTGTAHRSSSTRTILGDTETNLCPNPSFEGSVTSAWRPWVTSSGWTPTAQAQFQIASVAARRGRLGAEITNMRRSGSTYEGATHSWAETSTGTHIISCYVRRAEWKKNDRAPNVKFRIDTTDLDPTFAKVGRGWFRASATFAGSTSARAHGLVVAPNKSVQVDQVLCQSGSTLTAYFDGDGTDDTNGVMRGGGTAKLYQYDHPDASNKDDGADFSWNLRSAWFPFGIVREERRVRRSWGLVRGEDQSFLVRGYINYRPNEEYLVEQTASEADPVTFAEGLNVDTAFSVSLEVSGVQAPAAVLGMSAQTQPRRIRHHN